VSQPPHRQQPAWGTPPPQPTPPPKKGNPKVAAIGCASLLAVIVAVGVIAVATDDSDGKPLDESAAVMCEEFVKKRLKSPGSAEFPGVMDSDYAKTTTLSSNKPWKYKVTGAVDSQNGFGATVRSDYICTVSTQDNDTWTLDDLDLIQR
jgi:hypothetical protein